MATEIDLSKFFFPHEKVRDIQDAVLIQVNASLENRQHLILHAPTGIGKTAVALAPCLKHALEKDLTVFFLTSRHTQHRIAIETLRKIREMYGLSFAAADIIGKKYMCPQPNAQALYSQEFNEFCHSSREEGYCQFYNNIRKKGKVSEEALKVIDELKKRGPEHSENVVKLCQRSNLCPYEILALLAKEAHVIVTDYSYMFTPSIRQNFLQKSGKELSKCIIVIDEGHNLPKRLRESMSEKLTSLMIRNAVQEAKKHGNADSRGQAMQVGDAMQKLSSGLQDERTVERQELVDACKDDATYGQIAADLVFIGEEIREKQRQSYLGSVGRFLTAWQGPDNGFVRILTKKPWKQQQNLTLSYRCLDPGLHSQEVVRNSYSTIIMSGTLTPTGMYKDLLGFPENTIECVYGSPFPQKNKLTLVIPETTTKFTARNEGQYKRIAEIAAGIANAVPGNSIIFFPSYRLRDDISTYFNRLCNKSIFTEEPGLSKEEKAELLENFKKYEKQGAVLLAAVSGSFGEGIDLPGDYLKGVVVVGLPLERPDLETKALIDYYEKKFGCGWDYGYLFPAMNRAIQNAGRCIRSETDRGVVAFLDQRYSWSNYFRCFPKDWKITVTKDYAAEIKRFFGS